MFCKNCGKYNPDSEVKCKYCGGTLSGHPSYRKEQHTFYVDRTLAGVLLCIFLGVIGLAIGFLSYYDGDERESFLRAWFKTFIVMTIVSIVVMLVGGSCIIATISELL